MIINQQNLDIVFNAFNAAYLDGFGSLQAASEYEMLSMVVESTTYEETYPWLDDITGMREWLGDRVAENLSISDFRIANRDFEKTIEVDRNHIEDDRYGTFSRRFSLMGQAVARHPNELVFPLLKAGHETECYDGQFFFDTDHPVGGGTYSNSLAPQSSPQTPWYLMDLSTMFKPIIFQRRKAADNLIRFDQPTDKNVFERRRFVYGVDCRDNVGFGFWQLACRSTYPLDQDNFAAAYKQMEEIKGTGGQPLGIMPTHLVVPTSLRKEATALMENERDTNGATNTVKGWATPFVSRWLAA